MFEDFICSILGHDEDYTDEYQNQMGHLQANKVCRRCEQHMIAWTGPPIAEVPDLEETEVPSKEEAISEVLSE